ncbi:MAG: FemAB family XrtA/PEP-CTERM system-associated protein [bacterium]
MITVRPYRLQDEEKWNGFVDAVDQGTVFHKIVWKKIIERTYGYKACYLLASEDDEIVGILPLFHLKSVFIGNALLSTPFAAYGGVIATNKEVEDRLIAAAKNCAKDRRATYIELRQFSALENETLQTRDSLYVTFFRELIPEDQEQNFKNLPREAHRMVRRGSDKGLEVRLATDAVDEFYEIYAASVRNLGTPVFPKALFKNCLELMDDNADLLMVYQQKKAIAGVLSFYYKRTVLPYYGGSLPEANYLGPNNYMYWKLMEHAAQRGCTCFDFGRSKNKTGAFNFKRHMGFKPKPLPYQYLMMNGRDLPNLNPTNPKFKLAINMWRKLPLGVTKAIGPRIVKEFP